MKSGKLDGIALERNPLIVHRRETEPMSAFGAPPVRLMTSTVDHLEQDVVWRWFLAECPRTKSRRGRDRNEKPLVNTP